MSVFLQPIYTQTVGAGGVSSIIFNNIPQGFTDLRLVISARSLQGSAWDDMFMYFNNSSLSEYSYTIAYGLPSVNTFSGSDIGPKGWAGWANGNTTTANSYCNNVVYINNYSGGEWKSWATDTVVASPADSAVPMGFLGGCWRNNAPITTISLANATGNVFMQGTTVTLYGVSDVYDTTIPAAPTIGAVTDLGGVAGVAFTANDSGQGRTADSYSVFDQTIMSAPVYSNLSPVAVPVAVNSTYNNLAVSANNGLGSNASANPAGFTSYNNFASIATFTATGSQSSVIFSNIPQYYKHLHIRICGKETNNGTSNWFGLMLNFNNDTGANYTFHGLGTYAVTGGGAQTIEATGAINQTSAVVSFPRANGESTTFAGILIDINNYTSSTFGKTMQAFGGFVHNTTSNRVDSSSAAWNSLTPITAVTFSYAAAWASGTTIALYGVS